MNWLYRGLLVFGCLLLLSGCGRSLIRQGDQALQHHNYAMAEAYFTQALQKNPDNARARRGLGQVFYHLKNYDEAVKHLELARQGRPDDGLVYLYLGLIKEAQDDFEGAEQVYSSYLARDSGSGMAAKIKGRVLYVRNSGIRQQVREAIKLEKEIMTGVDSTDAIGILPFVLIDDMSDSLRPLANGLAAAVWYDLAQIENIKLVERLQLKYLLEELRLAEEEFTAAESSPRLGRLVGAGYLVNGSLSIPDKDQISVQSGIIRTSAAEYSLAFNSSEILSKLVHLQKQMTFAIIDSLGIKLTPQQRNRIEKISTENFNAFLAYSRGIEQLDQGNLEGAYDYFNQAATLDPGFEQAVSLQQETGLLIEGSGTAADFETSVVSIAETVIDVPGAPAENVFDITDPENDPRNDDDPAVETGSVTIGGSIR